MKNSFNIKVNFMSSPRLPYEWDKYSNCKDVKLERVSSKTLKNILLYEGHIQDQSGVILVSDAKNAIALKLNDEGKILKRSFLGFEQCLDICEYACNLRESKLDFIATSKKVNYDRELSIEKEMKDYILNLIKKSENEDLVKYLYYLYFNEVDSFSKEKLIKFVKNSSLGENEKIYDFLTLSR